MPLNSRLTKQHLYADAVERILSAAGREMHYAELATAAAELLGSLCCPRQLNGILHDDITGRFCRTARGTWGLSQWTRANRNERVSPVSSYATRA